QLAAKFPIRLDGGRVRLVEGAAFGPVPLTHVERLLLALALEHPALRRRPKLAAAIASLEAKLRLPQSPPEASPVWSLASLDRTGPAADGVLSVLERAAAEQRVCEATYASMADGRPRLRRLHPLRLFVRGDAWYLAAWTPEHGEVRTFR